MRSGHMDRAIMTLRFMAAPTRRWLPGHVSAGRVLEWIDKAGYACAVAWSGSYSVTAYVGNVSFTRPVQVGDIVEAAARIVQTGRSSMNILVTVRSGTIASNLLNQSTECLLILAATDANGRTTPVAAWTAATEEDHQRQTSAMQLKKNAQRH